MSRKHPRQEETESFQASEPTLVVPLRDHYKMICETIPSEILCEIFQFLCDEPISLHVLDNSSCFGEFPWAVGQVCKRWRDEFLSYPHLWTSLSLRHYPTDILGVDRLHEMSRRTLLYLERSERLPLTITVHTASIETFPRTTWKLLLSCSGRWERANLTLSHETPLLDLLRCNLPIVKSLKLHAVLTYSSYLLLMLYNPFTSAPRLTEVDLLGRFVGLAFPWSQLTKVKISFLDHGVPLRCTMLEAILSQLQNVEEIRVGNVNVKNDLPDNRPFHVRLASLRLLAVPTYPFEILRRIEAPSLEHLWVDWPFVYKQHYSLGFTEELSFFIRRSSCHIRRLTLQVGECRLLLSIMKILPSVEELCINTMIFGSGTFFAEHITQMNDGVCLPNLRKLEVRCLRGRCDDDELMATTSQLLEMRSEQSRLISVSREDVPLQPTMVRLSMLFK